MNVDVNKGGRETNTHVARGLYEWRAYLFASANVTRSPCVSDQ